MTRLEDHYRLHPFTFFITHMVGMVAFLVVVISGVVMAVHPDVGEAARRAHGVSSALLLLCFVAEVVEVVVVKLASAGKTNPPAWLQVQSPCRRKGPQGRRRLCCAQHYLMGGVADYTRYHAGLGVSLCRGPARRTSSSWRGTRPSHRGTCRPHGPRTSYPSGGGRAGEETIAPHGARAMSPVG